MEGTRVDYNLISCDDHLDLNQLPEDLWTERLSRSDRERAPHVEQRDGMWLWVYPHPDSIWPNSVATLKRTMGHLPAATIKKITHDNAAKLYGLAV